MTPGILDTKILIYLIASVIYWLSIKDYHISNRNAHTLLEGDTIIIVKSLFLCLLCFPLLLLLPPPPFFFLLLITK